eukprot:22962-Eustigmatos_ZCMA.PRE.1
MTKAASTIATCSPSSILGYSRGDEPLNHNSSSHGELISVRVPLCLWRGVDLPSMLEYKAR